MDNVAFLTAGNAVYSKKRAKKRAGLEKLTFNPEERRCLYPIPGMNAYSIEPI
jgi:hypothetical protein